MSGMLVLEGAKQFGHGGAVELELPVSTRELREGSPKPYDCHVDP